VKTKAGIKKIIMVDDDKESDIIDDLGADCFVPKPVNTIDLVNRLKVILS
jgi:DNA-binding response OmpR family regulator